MGELSRVSCLTGVLEPLTAALATASAWALCPDAFVVCGGSSNGLSALATAESAA